MPIITARDLSKRFRVASKQPGLAGTLRHFIKREHRQIDAVRNVSFTIEPGEIVGFLGPNGAGKTTTLKMLTGLIHPSTGEVAVAGHVPFRREAAFLRKITLVMGQKQQLIWDLPTLDSLRINAAVYGVNDADYRERITELSTMLGLDGQLKQPVRKLSLGERMKAELMAALLHRPEILFLDEPTLGLDVNAQAAVREFLHEYNRRFGATVLLTSHYMNDITALCKRVLLIHQGRLIYDGSLSDVLDHFAEYRQVELKLGRAVSSDVLAGYGEVESLDGLSAKLIVHRERLKQTIERLLAELDVADMTVTDPPVEEIIGRVFKEGVVAMTNDETRNPNQ